jgi:hypothetical protein
MSVVEQLEEPQLRSFIVDDECLADALPLLSPELFTPQSCAVPGFRAG